MATKQGMCRNCGSLVMYDDREELCECVFCNCVFPSKEAAEILENPSAYEFKNEKFEKQEGAKHYYSNPVMPDLVGKAVNRDKVSKQKQADELKLKASEFEISPNDVKAPKNLVIGMIAGTVVLVAVILAISLPLFFSRRALSSSIKADIDTIFELQAPGSTDEAPAFEYKQVNVYGISCQYVRLGLSDEVTEDQARTLYSNYAKLRADKRGEDSGDVEMYIYTPDTVFFINEEGLTKDVQQPVEILEPTEETEK
ncbi:MAG: hypothetical protein IKH20_07625 [Clostridiales bacterium]|nr:hypothetical protein [Clostridiales bacterium]